MVAAQRLRTNHGPWRLRIRDTDDIAHAVLKAGRAAEWSELYTCEAAALELAQRNNIAAPALLRLELDVEESGRSALLMTYLPGSTMIPIDSSAERLRSVGAMAATIHRVPLSPSNVLPRRRRHTSWTNFSLWRRWALRYRSSATGGRRAVVEAFLAEHPTGGTDAMTGATGWPFEDAELTLSATPSSSLLDHADELLATTTPTDEPTVFVHGDLWHGNTLWEEERCIAVLDWELAGAGQPGVDLGCLRWDAVMLHGPWAADEVLAAWEDTAGRRATSVAYWDLSAALNYPADIGRLTQVMAEFGRPDLDERTLNDRRDAFVEDAMRRIERSERS